MSITGYFFYYLVLVWISLMVITITYYKHAFKYWSQRGVDGPEPTVIFGNGWDVANGSKTMGELWKKIYLELKSKGLRHGGGYFMAKPMYTVVSLDLVKAIMQTDYQYFNSHGTYVNEKVDPLSINIFNLDGNRWKEIRTKITPTFTTGKIKMMFNTMVECSILLEELLQESESDNPVEIRNVMSRFTIDTIGSSAFGIETNTMKDPNSEFRKHGLMMFNMNPVEAMRQFCVIFTPHWLLRAINFSTINSKIRKFFYYMAVDTIKYREEHNIVRNDFMHLMVQMKNGKFVDDKGEKTKGRLTMNEVAAQCFFFFLAGFETSSTTICFASYELALHKEIQDRARHEIKEVLKKYNNEITYDALMEMHYLETVIYETLRKYPPLQFLLRKCTDNYKVPDSNIVIEKGMVTIIPVLGLHFDPEYYPDPEKFDPERFNAENKKTIPQFAWLPFGEGPRICLGLRFGMVQVKIGLISLLKNYEFTLHEKTISPIVYTKTSVLASAKGGIWLNLRKIH
ncbi:probable cytochrome P450 6a20 [Leptinotarsa decemlineata]|uniref:probable cytochrome P450 6a20 n=1 Tax=Leptinotarsa decemlineata TaxID=7539 RepID=UPI003D304A2E